MRVERPFGYMGRMDYACREKRDQAQKRAVADPAWSALKLHAFELRCEQN